MGRPGYGKNKYILALDMGTSSLHCLLADSWGRPAKVATAPVRFFTPPDCPATTREFDPAAILDTLGGLIARVLKADGRMAEDISAIAVTSQRQGTVFVDGDGTELYAGPNIDLRAIFEGAAMDEEYGEQIYATTGHFPSMIMAPARLRWFRQNRPAVYDRTRTILTVAAWLAYRLTGNATSEPCLEGEAGLLDVETESRSAGLMDKLEVPLSLLPALSSSGVPAGRITREMADGWGLKAGVPVFVAGPDTQCGLLGMGIVDESSIGAVVGWSGALQALTSRPCWGEGMRTWVGCYPLEGLWVAEANLGDAGNAYRWLKDILLGTETPFEEADRLAEEATASCDGVAAFLGPGHASPWELGLRMGGLLFPTPLSFQETSRGQLFRAALEALAYSVKANLATLHGMTGGTDGGFSLGGGMSCSRTLAVILAGVIGTTIRRSTTSHVSARGAALIAAAATNPELSLEQAAHMAAAGCEEVDPAGASEIAQYQESYQQWVQLHDRLRWDQ